jgi:hypothetical protein
MPAVVTADRKPQHAQYPAAQATVDAVQLRQTALRTCCVPEAFTLDDPPTQSPQSNKNDDEQNTHGRRIGESQTTHPSNQRADYSIQEAGDSTPGLASPPEKGLPDIPGLDQ